MFGVDDLAIAGIIASIASAGMQYKAGADATKRQKAQALTAQQRALQAQNEATQAASRRAADYDPATRQANQQQVEQVLTDNLTQQISQPQITAQGVQVGATLPQGQGTTDYTIAKAREEAKAKASLHGLAALMGRIGGATELRRGEAVAMGDTAGQIGRIQTGAGNVFGADQAGIEAAGNPNPGLMFASQMLRAGGGYGVSKGATKQPENVNAGSAWA